MKKDYLMIKNLMRAIQEDVLEEKDFKTIKYYLDVDRSYPLNKREYHLILLYEDRLIDFYGKTLQLTNAGHDALVYLARLPDNILVMMDTVNFSEIRDSWIKEITEGK